MKASVEKLHNLGINTVEISILESRNISEQVLNNTITDVIITDYPDTDLSEYEVLFIMIVMGYFDKFKDRVITDIKDEYAKVEELYTVKESTRLQDDLRWIINNNRDEILKSVSTVYDFNKKQILEKFGITFSGKIDVVSKELLAKKLMDDLQALVQDYNRTLSKMINSNINLTVDDLLKNLNKLKNDVPLINKEGKATTTLTSRIRAIARTTETLIKNQAILNTGLQLGLNEYNVVTMHDGRVCPRCLEIEAENPYTVDDGKLPPFHSFCRCIIQWITNNLTNNPKDIDRFFDIASGMWIGV